MDRNQVLHTKIMTQKATKTIFTGNLPQIIIFEDELKIFEESFNTKLKFPSF